MIPPHILWERGALRLLDQRALPAREEWVSCKTWREVAEAIKNMTVRGAPLIGVAGAFGCALAVAGASDSAGWREEIGLALDELAQARPTAVNLAWAVDRMREDLPLARSASELADIWLSKALALQKEDEETCRAIGKAGEAIVPQKASVLTHCNAGALATAGYGTALGVIRAGLAGGAVQPVQTAGAAFTPHAPRIPPRPPGPKVVKGFNPPFCSVSTAPSLTLSNFAYTEFYTMPQRI